MRFKEFLAEAKKMKPSKMSTKKRVEIAKRIQEECQPLLKMTRGKLNSSNCLWRGINTVKTGFIYSVRKNRQSKDTPIEVQDALDKYFVTHFKYPYRKSGLFVTSNENEADEYGTLHAIFPIGNFSFLWSKSYDDLYLHLNRPLMNDIRRLARMINKGSQSDSVLSDYDDSLTKLDTVLDAGEYTDKNLLGAIQSEHEIMIACDKFIAVPHGYIDDMFFKFLYGKVGEDALI